MTTTAAQTLKIDYVKTIGIVNNAPVGRGFANPIDLALHADGRIFVLNRGAPVFTRVGVTTMDDDYLYEFASHGDGEGQLRLAAGITLSNDGSQVYVTDEYNHRVSVFNADFDNDKDTANSTFIKAFGAKGSGPGEFDGPTGIVADADDNLYITDQNNHRVQKITPEGRHLLSFGSEGNGDGEFNMPWGISLAPDGSVFVADWRNDRIQQFSADGEFIAKYGESGDGDGQFSRPSGVAIDADGNIYVTDWGNERVQALTADGSHVRTLRGEATLSKWALDFLAANPDEVETRKISNLTPELPPHLDTPHLISSQIEPYFWGPSSVNFDADGRMFITESSRHRIQVYQLG